ncbi:MAG: rhomboid family intramembrane serine protease [Candidatus Altiarchaeia archaeon]
MKIFGYYVGAVEALMAANVIIFMVSLANFNWFIENYALFPATVAREPWTLVTSMFLHGGFDHIIFNMFSLFFFGIYLGQIIGEKELLKVYFAGGIFGGILFTFSALFLGMPGSPYASAIGASGAIFALGGALAVLRPKMMVFILPIPVPMPLWMSVFGFMLLLSFLPGIAWQGHVGGLIVGALYGRWYKKKEPLTGHLYGMYDR